MDHPAQPVTARAGRSQSFGPSDDAPRLLGEDELKILAAQIALYPLPHPYRPRRQCRRGGDYDWLVKYAESGVHTFVVNQRGIVYEADLGSDTDTIVEAMKSFNPDDKWVLSDD